MKCQPCQFLNVNSLTVQTKFYALHQGIAEFVILVWEWLFFYLISHFYFFLNYRCLWTFINWKAKLSGMFYIRIESKRQFNMLDLQIRGEGKTDFFVGPGGKWAKINFKWIMCSSLSKARMFPCICSSSIWLTITWMRHL